MQCTAHCPEPAAQEPLPRSRPFSPPASALWVLLAFYSIRPALTQVLLPYNMFREIVGAPGTSSCEAREYTGCVKKHKLQFNWRLQPASPRRDAPAAGYWLRPEDAKTGGIHCTKGVGYIPQCARCARLIRGFLSQRDSSPPKRHLDRLSVFAWLTGVPNTQARRPRYAAQTSVAIGRICAEYDMKSWRNKFICNSKKSVDNEARTRLRRPRVGHGSGRVGSGRVR